jgi:hypothetical protein
MGTMHRFFVGIALVITLWAAGAAWGDASIVGGNVIVDRQLADTFQNFHTMDTNHPFNADGNLTHWEIFAENTNPVQLVIYRQEGGVFYVVGRSKTETPHVGYNLFELGDAKIKVQAGDFVGMYHPSMGSVSYILDPPDEFDFGDGNLTGTILQTSSNSGLSNATNFIISSNRHYSIRAMRDQLDAD